MPEIPLARGWLKARGCGGQVAGCEAVRLRAGRCEFFVIFFDGILKIPESQWFFEGDCMGAFIASVFFQFGFAIFLQMSWSFGWEMVGDCKSCTSEGCKFIGIIGE